MKNKHLRILIISICFRFFDSALYDSTQFAWVWYFINLIELTLYSAFYEEDFLNVI